MPEYFVSNPSKSGRFDLQHRWPSCLFLYSVSLSWNPITRSVLSTAVHRCLADFPLTPSDTRAPWQFISSLYSFNIRDSQHHNMRHRASLPPTSQHETSGIPPPNITTWDVGHLSSQHHNMRRRASLPPTSQHETSGIPPPNITTWDVGHPSPQHHNMRRRASLPPTSQHETSGIPPPNITT